MELPFKLLEHPFYKDWECGKVTMEQLAKYAESYKDFIELMPEFWKKISKGFSVDNTLIKKIIAEETTHIDLWNNWTEKLPEIEDFPKLIKIIECFNNFTPSELLGAVHAFEVQQPEVAKSKKNGLIKFYGFEIGDLKYFEEHEKEDEHIAYGIELYKNKANKKEFESGFNKASELLYQGLDLYLN